MKPEATKSSTIAVIIPITPVPKPRMTQRDKWQVRPPVARYRAFADELRLRVNTHCPEILDFEAFDAVFYMPMPLSWSRKKRISTAGKPHQQIPDRDNLLKALQDVLWPDGDQRIYDGRVAKFWAAEDDPVGYIRISSRVDNCFHADTQRF